jgi:hypothetical protein
MDPALAADIVVLFHLIYVAFTVGGEVVILIGGIFGLSFVRNFSFRIIHLAAVLFVAAEALLGVLCPLTELEYRLRRAAGQRVEEEITFIGQLIRAVIFYDFPAWFFTLLYAGFGLLVALSFVFIPPHRRSKSRQTRRARTESK